MNTHDYNNFGPAAPRAPRRNCAGFTLVEVMVASTIALATTTMVMMLLIWCAEQSSLCSKIMWSQREAMRTSDRLTTYLRNASRLTAIDVSGGNWVEFQFPDGGVARLVYSNAVDQLRDGRMYLIRTNNTETIIARGMTAVMDSQGFTAPVFSSNHDNLVRIAYRVSEPTAAGLRAADDADFAACVKLTVCLRNAVP